MTGLINAIMNSPDWGSTAIFLSWDEWGGFYDHGQPPNVDQNGFGLRAPGIVISPYARQGYIDHHATSHDAYDKFIEDDFLGGQRLDPSTDGRPDPRSEVRESLPQVADPTTPALAAIVRQLQCVSPGGVSCSVRRTIFSTSLAGIEGLRPRPERTAEKFFSPSSENRSRHAVTVAGDT